MVSISKQLCISLLVISCLAQADSLQPNISQQVAQKNRIQQNIEIVDYDITRDYEAVKAIMKEGWATLSTGPYSQAMMEKILVHRQSCNHPGQRNTIKVARINGKTVGAMVYAIGYYDMVELLAVDANHRNQGIGFKLLSCAQDMAQKTYAPGLELLVYNHNQPAMKLYQKFGFMPAQISKTTTLMQKHLSEPVLESYDISQIDLLNAIEQQLRLV